ncbi:MAG: hypothetical protein ACYS5V_16795, partial [Planctomycetota bacterium]
RINAYAATGDVARGGRAKWFLMDELGAFRRGPDKEAMASTQHMTESRLIVSTPGGPEGAYYDAMHEPSGMVKVILDWKDNPVRNRGLYTMDKGVLTAVDPENNPLPEGYAENSKNLLSRLRTRGFKLDGVTRSPWYDEQCDRPGATPKSIAQELDRDYGGSTYRIFGAEFFGKTDESVRPPYARGEMGYHPETLVPDFETVEKGPLLLWTALNARRKPPRHDYVIGADVSSGLGGSYTSNSAAVVVDATTMEQVAEYASNTITPADFADLCIALAKWFHDAYLAWEHEGPGTAFTAQVLRRKYSNVYRRTILWRKGRKKTKEVGWVTNARTKEAMFTELGRSVRSGELKIRSRTLSKECGEYVRVNGKIVHVLSVSTDDDSSKGKAHGDRAIALGVCLQGVRDRALGLPSDEKRPRVIPPNCMAARQEAYEQTLREKASNWDDRSNWDLTGVGVGL